MTGPWDVGSALIIGMFLVAPMSLMRARNLRLRHPLVLSVLAFLVGVASLFGRRP